MKAKRRLSFGKPEAIQAYSTNALIALALLVFLGTPIATAQTISTLAGNGTAGFSGDGSLAGSAALNRPRGVTFDASGNVYITDYLNNRVRRISVANQTIATFVGSGAAAFGGDGGAAVNAQLNQPEDVAMDASGTLYIADSQNQRIRKVTPDGTISTFAGTGIPGYNGDSMAATDARLNRPTSIAIDASGNLYIADASNHRVRRITNGIITTIAGNGIQGYTGDGGAAAGATLRFPLGVAVDAAGNVYIADAGNHVIRKVTVPSNIISTVVGNGVGAGTDKGSFSGNGGFATSAGLNTPNDVTLDVAGNIYIADTANYRIRKVSGGIISTLAGTGSDGFSGDGGLAVNATLNLPWGVSLDASGNLSIGDMLNNRIRRIAGAGSAAVASGTVTSGGGGGGGGGTISNNIYYLPHLALGGGWQTTLTYVNYSPQSVTCETFFFSDGGGPLAVSFGGAAAVSSRTDSLGPGRSIHTESTANISAPETRGWARVGCTGPIKASLLFRFYQGAPTSEASVNATTTPATTFVTFADQRTGVAYANPSSQPAQLTFTAISSSGATLGTRTITLGAGAHGAENMGPFLGISSFRGAIRISSTVPIVSLSLNAEAFPVFSSLPPGELDGSAALTYFFPHLALGGGWQTTLTYINFSLQTVTCTTSFFADSGAPLGVPFGGAAASIRTDTLPPGGSIHTESTASLSALETRGWARATCSAPIKASLLFRFYQGGPRGEASVNAMTAAATKFVTFSDQLTGVAYANPSGQTANVTFTAISSTGAKLASKSIPVLPGEHGAANIGPFLGISSFRGSIQIVSSTPIVSLSLNAEAFPVVSSLPPGELDGSASLH
ncbi:MAG: hypothetical protein HY648_02940 [Acidobacteria bacterium]|nr:hypothetical protein [Acidobacteriota bacterium]